MSVTTHAAGGLLWDSTASCYVQCGSVVQTWRWLCERAKDAPALRRKPDDAEPKVLSDALLLWLLAR